MEYCRSLKAPIIYLSQQHIAKIEDRCMNGHQNKCSFLSGLAKNRVFKTLPSPPRFYWIFKFRCDIGTFLFFNFYTRVELVISVYNK